MNSTMATRGEGVSRVRRRMQFNCLTLAIATAVGVLTLGCLERPIAESKPVTTNVVVQKQANNAITGIDLLLMIDNSSSMADKQKVLAAAVPQLLKQLVAPQCVDAAGAP